MYMKLLYFNLAIVKIQILYNFANIYICYKRILHVIKLVALSYLKKNKRKMLFLTLNV
jgi:hypothetical protein